MVGRRRLGPSPPPSLPSQIPDSQALRAPPASLLLLVPRSPARGGLPSPTSLLSPSPSHPLPPPFPQPVSLSFIHPFTKLLLGTKAPLGPGARLAGVENKTKALEDSSKSPAWCRLLPPPSPPPQPGPPPFDLHPAFLSVSALWPTAGGAASPVQASHGLLGLGRQHLLLPTSSKYGDPRTTFSTLRKVQSESPGLPGGRGGDCTVGPMAHLPLGAAEGTSPDLGKRKPSHS